MQTDSKSKQSTTETNLAEQYDKLKQDFADLEREEKQLKDYLNINVFDYAQNQQNIEDIFAVNNTSMSLLDYDSRSQKINPNIPIIEINNLTKFYSSRKIPSLLNVSLRLYLGDIHVIIGPSGSGKTTLFNCLRGLEDFEGEILLEGKAFNAHPDFYSNQLISFVPYEFGWDSYSTVEDVISSRFQELNLTEIETQNYIRSSLERLDISYTRNLHIIDLTLLEKRKVQIVISLITDPHVIVLDEVFLGLQQHECFDLLLIFNQLKQNTRAILLLSHSFNDFIKFSNSMTVLSEGKVYYTGAVSDFLYSKILNYSITVEDNKKAIEILSKIEGCNFTYKDAINTILANFNGRLSLFKFQQECAKEGIIIKELKLLETRVEDLFPVLKHSGSRDAIKTINSKTFFAP